MERNINNTTANNTTVFSSFTTKLAALRAKLEEAKAAFTVAKAEKEVALYGAYKAKKSSTTAKNKAKAEGWEAEEIRLSEEIATLSEEIEALAPQAAKEEKDVAYISLTRGNLEKAAEVLAEIMAKEANCDPATMLGEAKQAVARYNKGGVFGWLPATFIAAKVSAAIKAGEVGHKAVEKVADENDAVADLYARYNAIMDGVDGDAVGTEEEELDSLFSTRKAAKKVDKAVKSLALKAYYAISNAAGAISLNCYMANAQRLALGAADVSAMPSTEDIPELILRGLVPHSIRRDMAKLDGYEAAQLAAHPTEDELAEEARLGFYKGEAQRGYETSDFYSYAGCRIKSYLDSMGVLPTLINHDEGDFHEWELPEFIGAMSSIANDIFSSPAFKTICVKVREGHLTAKELKELTEWEAFDKEVYSFLRAFYTLWTVSLDGGFITEAEKMSFFSAIFGKYKFYSISATKAADSDLVPVAELIREKLAYIVQKDVEAKGSTISLFWTVEPWNLKVSRYGEPMSVYSAAALDKRANVTPVVVREFASNRRPKEPFGMSSGDYVAYIEEAIEYDRFNGGKFAGGVKKNILATYGKKVIFNPEIPFVYRRAIEIMADRLHAEEEAKKSNVVSILVGGEEVETEEASISRCSMQQRASAAAQLYAKFADIAVRAYNGEDDGVLAVELEKLYKTPYFSLVTDWEVENKRPDPDTAIEKAERAVQALEAAFASAENGEVICDDEPIGAELSDEDAARLESLLGCV